MTSVFGWTKLIWSYRTTGASPLEIFWLVFFQLFIFSPVAIAVDLLVLVLTGLVYLIKMIFLGLFWVFKQLFLWLLDMAKEAFKMFRWPILAVVFAFMLYFAYTEWHTILYWFANVKSLLV